MATLLGAHTSFADTMDTMTITGDTATNTCLPDIWQAGHGVVNQYWRVYGSNFGSAVTPCGQTIDLTGADPGTITAQYYAGTSLADMWNIAGETTAQYGSAPVQTISAISLPTDGVMASVGVSAGDTFASLVPVLIGIAGLTLAFFVVKQVIGLIPKARSKK